MAQNFIQKLIVKLLLLLLASAMISSAEAKKLKKTKMSLYIKDYLTGPNSTVTAIAGIAGKQWTFTQFGTLYVTDDLVTETPAPNSALIGRSQGTYVTSGLDGRCLHVSISIVFIAKKYAGSTLELQGAYKHFQHSAEISVVSGTGKFRFVRGYATFETYSWNATTGHTILRWNITVLHFTEKYL